MAEPAVFDVFGLFSLRFFSLAWVRLCIYIYIYIYPHI